jgi:hypothetical protein
MVRGEVASPVTSSSATGSSNRLFGSSEEVVMGGLLDNLFGGADNVVAQAKELLGGQMPDTGQLGEIVAQASPEQLQGVAAGVAGQLSPDALGQIGPLVAQFMEQSGQVVPGVDLAALAAGDTAAVGEALGGLLQQDGLAALTGIFGAAQAGAEQGGLGGLVGGVMSSLGIGGGDLAALMENPAAFELLSKLVPQLQGLRG